MNLGHNISMRMDQRQLLTPRMIQSMEILQLPLMALEERIDQEMISNPVLEVNEGDADAPPDTTDHAPAHEQFSDGEIPLNVQENSNGSEDFTRLEKLSEYLENDENFSNSGTTYRAAGGEDGERDGKMDAMANTASRGESISEHLIHQWTFVEASPEVKQAGEILIQQVDADGYIRQPLEEIQQAARVPVQMDHLKEALTLIQTLDPNGVGARNLAECLLIQLDALDEDPELSEGHDIDLERALVRDHLGDLENNRYPQISKKLNRSIEEIKSAVRHLARLHPHPGRQVAGEEVPIITPDAIVYLDEDTGKYEIKMARDPSEHLSISPMYRKMIKDRKGDKTTREFLANNVRNAKWLIESIQQRKNTIQRVIRVVVDAQKEFLDNGPEFLKPLPMVQVADQLGIHVATVSRAVSEKWIQTPRGIFPLRRFFTGGTQNSEGEDMSWDAVKEKLKVIIDHEDKNKPLNDDEIVAKLQEQGIKLARRTVAKYRDALSIPTARQRRQF